MDLASLLIIIGTCCMIASPFLYILSKYLNKLAAKQEMKEEIRRKRFDKKEIKI